MLIYTEDEEGDSVDEIQIELEELCQDILILERNFNELMHSIEHQEGQADEKVLISLQNLHNYLSAYYMQKEKAQAFTTKVEKRDLGEEYIENLERENFMDSYKQKLGNHRFLDRGAFIEGLRNYTIHDHLPLVIGGHRFEGRSRSIETNSILLDREQLLRNDDSFDSSGGEFLEEQGRHIDIRELIQLQHNELLEFYSWMFQELDDILDADIRALWNAYSEYMSY